ncbi:Fasciclin FAS1 domain-containing protein [Orpheovirus IHUMI-LCC2]|uniref:Fasciclin FAS1 domain-containing protein n=1 Tax=Orpheovirus IHUMI-LCC2 TaxID=2023057 RepID=A0A2I2L5V0_9VIRU|nr:Fasciclin FAS1 domain-containing protein [Orpheovirus IHUMI-LCC2]SNW62891.1 Fasciclin FAS1 domain-containing protein [Orpheovirus IHUMI-LCC2]
MYGQSNNYILSQSPLNPNLMSNNYNLSQSLSGQSPPVSPRSSLSNLSYAPVSPRSSLSNQRLRSPRASRAMTNDSLVTTSGTVEPSMRHNSRGKRSSMKLEDGGNCKLFLNVYEGSNDEEKCRMVREFFERPYRVDRTLDMVKLLSTRDNLSKLYNVISRLGLDPELRAERVVGDSSVVNPSITVFAPINDAFMNIMDEDVTSDIIKNHIFVGALDSKNLLKAEGVNITTLSGVNIKVQKIDDMVYIIGSDGMRSRVVQADIFARNGVLHIIDKVIF